MKRMGLIIFSLVIAVIVVEIGLFVEDRRADKDLVLKTLKGK